MRNLSPGSLIARLAEEQNVQVQCPGAVAQARRAVPAELLFDGQQAAQQFFRLQLSLQADDCIHKARLRG